MPLFDSNEESLLYNIIHSQKDNNYKDLNKHGEDNAHQSTKKKLFMCL